jgi:hypothetical protein
LPYDTIAPPKPPASLKRSRTRISRTAPVTALSGSTSSFVPATSASTEPTATHAADELLRMSDVSRIRVTPTFHTPGSARVAESRGEKRTNRSKKRGKNGNLEPNEETRGQPTFNVVELQQAGRVDEVAHHAVVQRPQIHVDAVGARQRVAQCLR